MKNFKLKWLLVLVGVFIASVNTAWAVKYQPTKGVSGGSAVYGVVPQGAVMQSTGMQSQQMMSGGAYSGTVYEPFTNTTPSEANSPAKAPGGPRKGFYNPGEGGTQSDQSPIGEPWVMILFALVFAGVIAIRQYKKNLKVTENSNNSTMKRFNLFKMLAVLIVLITSINTAWAGAGYYAKDGTNYSELKFLKDGGDNWAKFVQNPANNTIDLGNVNSLSLDEYYVHVWKKGVNIASSTLYYRIYKSGDTPPSTFSNYGGGHIADESGGTDGAQNQTWGHGSGMGINCFGSGIIPGETYYFEYYFQTDQAGALNNSTYNYKVKFTVNQRLLVGDFTSWDNSQDSYALDNGTYIIRNVTSGDKTFRLVRKNNWDTEVGWNQTKDNDNCGTLKLSAGASDNNISVNIPSTSDVYIKYDGLKICVSTIYSVSVEAGDNGEVDVISVSDIDNAVKPSGDITATADDGYYFTDWTLPTGVTAAGGYSSTSNPIRIHASASGKTITANFAARWVLRGSDMSDGTDELPGWDATTANMTAGATTTKDVTLKPNTRYKYRIYDKKNSTAWGPTGDSDQPLGTAWTLSNTDHDAHFTTKGYGTYRFSVTVSGDRPSVTVSPQFTSYAVTIGQKTSSTGCGSPADSEGGSVEAEDSHGYPVTSGDYVENGGSVTFTAIPERGYQFKGWYGNSDCSGVVLSTDAEYTATISGATTVYAKFEEILFSVWVWENGSYGFQDVGVKSHPSISSTSPDGKVFLRWDVTGTATVADPYSSTTTITGASDNNGQVIARYQDPPTLYYVIDKIPAGTWTPSKMYVYFYDNNYWDDKKGSGSKSGCLTHAGREMTPVAGKNNRWWKYTFNPETDPDLAGHTIQTVSFMSKSQNNYDNFDDSNTGTHRIYQSCMNMFIVTKSSGQNLNGCWYYNDGYWYNYEGTKSGYYLHGLPGDEEELIADEAGNYSASVNLEANHDYYFYIGGCDGKNWSNEETYKGNSHKHQVGIYGSVDGDGNRIKLTTNVGGLYTFTLTPIYNTVDEYAHMDLDITYPILAGDYRAVNTTPTKDLPSNNISSTSDGDTISLWLQAGENDLAFKEAAVNGSTGALTWTARGSQTVNVAKNGVYTMILSKTGATTYAVSTPEEYTGKFYIRTDCAPGKWKDYKENTMSNNTLTFNTGDATTYDYYYCKWLKDAGSNVRFVVANDWNIAISDTLIHDAALGSGTEETLPEAANVRFSYNSYTNTLNRAYLSSFTDKGNTILVLHGNDKLLSSSGTALTDNEAHFSDLQNWVYEADLQAKSGATVYLTSLYNEKTLELYASSAAPKTILTSTSGMKAYPIKAIYDFKTNNMMVAWHPGEDAIEERLSDLTSVMIVRDHQEAAEQITFGEDGSIAGSRVYGVMRFNKWTLNNQARTGEHPTLDPLKSVYERALYWISFPFDVRLKEVFGFGRYGIHWIVEYYDGAGRAERGWWVDSEANWKFYYTDSLQNGGPDGKGTILKANVGYVLGLDLDYFYTSSYDIWGDGAKADDAYLYFPSMRDDIVIDATLPTSVTVPAHQCTIDRRINKSVANTNLDRRVVDSHWNVIGVPSYSNVVGLDSVNQISDGTSNVAYPEGFGFYYAWNMETNKLDVTAKSNETTFLTMHGYMLQFTGTINWQTRKASLVAARERKRADQNFRLEIFNGTTKQDHTLLRITDDEGVTMRYDLNQDLCKESYADQANIWTLTDDTIPVAGNSLPYNEQITIVPVGVQIATDGEYTFSMPEGATGTGVVLIDNIAGTRTGLSLTDYTVNLTAGTYEGRFELEISPIVESPTGIDGVSDQNANVRKVMVDGILYIVKDGKVFDARGNRVQ